MVIQKMVDWYKRLGMFGWLRFRSLWFAHRFIKSSGLAEQWDFVLKYLPYTKECIFAIDAGCTYSLFIYELLHRGYTTYGIDFRPYQEKLPYEIAFFRQDIFEYGGIKVDYVILISVLQFIDEKVALFDKLCSMLMDNGKVLITIPTDTITFTELHDLAMPHFHIMEYQECKGHISTALIKKERK